MIVLMEDEVKTAMERTEDSPLVLALPADAQALTLAQSEN